MKLFSRSKPSTRAVPVSVMRTVVDRRWIRNDQLDVGMYVRELDRPWAETRFMFQGFRIDSVALLKRVKAECEYALVETEKLARVSNDSRTRSGHVRNVA